MRGKWHLVLSVVLTLVLVGCGKLGGTQEGSEQAARAFFTTEFNKWMGGQKSEVKTFKAGLETRLPPVGFEIRSVVPDKPDVLAWSNADLPGDQKGWPAYRFNVYIEWKSEAGSPLKEVATYNLTWNVPEKKWFVHEIP